MWEAIRFSPLLLRASLYNGKLVLGSVILVKLNTVSGGTSLGEALEQRWGGEDEERVQPPDGASRSFHSGKENQPASPTKRRTEGVGLRWPWQEEWLPSLPAGKGLWPSVVRWRTPALNAGVKAGVEQSVPLNPGVFSATEGPVDGAPRTQELCVLGTD